MILPGTQETTLLNERGEGRAGDEKEHWDVEFLEQL